MTRRVLRGRGDQQPSVSRQSSRVALSSYGVAGPDLPPLPPTLSFHHTVTTPTYTLSLHLALPPPLYMTIRGSPNPDYRTPPPHSHLTLVCRLPLYEKPTHRPTQPPLRFNPPAPRATGCVPSRPNIHPVRVTWSHTHR